jgi:HAD superfamily hydrolase (TIGR01549 family)
MQQQNDFNTFNHDNNKQQVIPVRGVIFDMDGTLTEPGAIDFKAMYDRIGIIKRNEAGGILQQIQIDLHPDLHEAAHQIIVEEELKGIEKLEIKSDLHHIINYFHINNIKIGISTRNSSKALDKFLEIANIRNNTFYPLISRESFNGINKPDPQVALNIADMWKIDTRHIWFVGDNVDDMRCGKYAGCKTCLIHTPNNQHYKALHNNLIDLYVSTLTEFIDYIHANHISILNVDSK